MNLLERYIHWIWKLEGEQTARIEVQVTRFLVSVLGAATIALILDVLVALAKTEVATIVALAVCQFIILLLVLYVGSLHVGRYWADRNAKTVARNHTASWQELEMLKTRVFHGGTGVVVTKPKKGMGYICIDDLAEPEDAVHRLWLAHPASTISFTWKTDQGATLIQRTFEVSPGDDIRASVKNNTLDVVITPLAVSDKIHPSADI